VKVNQLRCEDLKDPLGIDIKKPRLRWLLQSNERGQKQTAYQVLVASTPELLATNKGDLWDSGKVNSEQSIQVEYAGKTLTSRLKCFWKTRGWDRKDVQSDWSATALWSMGLLNPEDWTAKWIGLNPADGRAEFPCFRKNIILDQLPSDARIYINSLGYHEFYINGEKVGNDVLSPAVTQFSHRSFYLTHDVTALLREGTNCIALWLGRGWYFSGQQGSSEIQRAAGPVVRAQLEIYGRDGIGCGVGTDANWKTCSSPITRTDESAWSLCYDARLEQPGWNTVDFDDSHWRPAQEYAIGHCNACAQMVETNRITRFFTPVDLTPCEKDSWLVDMGTNLTGGLKVRFDGIRESGRKIAFDYYDHLLDENGQPMHSSGHDEYIMSGKDGEMFLSRFNYQGFRYIEISGLTVAPKKEDVSAFLIRTGFAAGSSFACSNERLTAIHDMVAYTFQCLTLGGYMVDCPHFERLGYGGDGQASLESALMMHRLGPMYRSWLTAWRDCQGPDGDLPHTAPSMYAGGGPYWCGFIIMAAWSVYWHYLDRMILEVNYPVMQKWLEFVESHCKNGDLFDIWPNTLRRNWYLGDWATPKGIDQKHIPSVKLVNNCFRIYCYDVMAQIAAVLDKPIDAARYQLKADSLRPVVHKAFFNPETRTYADGDQIDLAFPLLTNVVPADCREEIIRQLEQDILQKRAGHLAVGLVGIPVLVKLLMTLDRNDLIFTFANQDTYPGWGYMLKNGATTTWEHWEGSRSHIHNCYNGIGVWFYQGLAGIQPDQMAPGFKHFIVRPSIVGNLTWVKAAYNSIHGKIVSEWRFGDNRFEMKIYVPVGTTATVYIPIPQDGKVTESGLPVEETSEIKHLRTENRHTVYQVGSGAYVFSIAAIGGIPEENMLLNKEKSACRVKK